MSRSSLGHLPVFSRWEACANIFFIGLILLCSACEPTNVPEEGGKEAGTESMSKSAKRGVAFNFQIDTDLPLLSPFISWDYNWGVTTSSVSSTWFDVNGIDYCPMIWNGSYLSDINKERVRAYAQNHPATKFLLGFNEPNLTDQAHMTPQQAAALWPEVAALAEETNLLLVSPAMNYGTLEDYYDPIKWLDEFFAQPNISLSDIHAISVHCYMPDATSLINYINRFAKYGKPIWLTEFCAWENNINSPEKQIAYMCEALNYLEQSPLVERYAWFIPRYKTEGTYPYMQLINNQKPAGLTEAGKVYAYFSSFNKEEYLTTNRFIHAGEYCAVSSNKVQLRPATDEKAIEDARREGLTITDLPVGDTLTYHLSLPQQAQSLSLRYTSYSPSIMEVQINGKSIFIDLPSTSGINNWQTIKTDIEATTGNQEMKLILRMGALRFSGFQIN